MSRPLSCVIGLLAAAAPPCLAQSLTVDTPRGVQLEAIANFPAGNGPFPVVILGPGAEYPMNAPVLLEVARQLVERGVGVYRFNWGYVTADPKGGRASQNLVREVEDMAAVVAQARRDPRVEPDRVFVGGKSLGSMVAWRVLAADARLRGGLLLTPVCSRAKDGAIASQAEQNYPGIATERRPLSFIAGEQDPLCSAPVLYRFAAAAAGPARVAIVSGNHVFEDPRLAGDARAADLQRTVGIVGELAADFVARNLRP
ncbi:MAG: alpha/beta family hydrolase [Gemmatimonadaceae bacterium]